jgi:hypothetical protein
LSTQLLVVARCFCGIISQLSTTQTAYSDAQLFQYVTAASLQTEILTVCIILATV